MVSFDKSLKLNTNNGTPAAEKSAIYSTLQAINTLRKKKHLPLAEHKAKDYLEKNAFSIEVLTILVDVLVEQRSAQKALDIIQYYQSDIHKKPKCKELIAAQAKALLAINEKSKSLELIETTTAAFPDWADGWNNHGCTLLNLGRESEAIGKFEQALRLEPTHFKAALALATILKKYAQLSKAIETLQNCFNKTNNPNLLEALINLLNQAGHQLVKFY